jgi:hypothetical protein
VEFFHVLIHTAHIQLSTYRRHTNKDSLNLTSSPAPSSLLHTRKEEDVNIKRNVCKAGEQKQGTSRPEKFAVASLGIGAVIALCAGFK